jgi:hypothetical protein
LRKQYIHTVANEIVFEAVADDCDVIVFDTVGCDSMGIVATLGWRITSRTHSRQADNDYSHCFPPIAVTGGGGHRYIVRAVIMNGGTLSGDGYQPTAES